MAKILVVDDLPANRALVVTLVGHSGHQALEATDGASLLDDPHFRARLAQIEVTVQAVEISELRVLSALSAGKNPGAVSSVLKIQSSEAMQQLDERRAARQAA